MYDRQAMVLTMATSMTMAVLVVMTIKMLYFDDNDNDEGDDDDDEWRWWCEKNITKTCSLVFRRKYPPPVLYKMFKYFSNCASNTVCNMLVLD